MKVFISTLLYLGVLLFSGVSCGRKPPAALQYSAASIPTDPSAGEAYTNYFSLSEFRELPTFRAKIVAAYIRDFVSQSDQTNRYLLIFMQKEDGSKVCVSSIEGRVATERELRNASALEKDHTYTFPSELNSTRQP